MKLQFRQKELNKANQKEGLLTELSPEELEGINGGGWISQAYCDAYYYYRSIGDFHNASKMSSQGYQPEYNNGVVVLPGWS